ncbi:hypothetical protein [Marinobacter sp.]|uniref:hypothetical protein n=1 Tax=Marinobacter sp. TaxID=50741 RepID=UPI00384E722D
MKAVGFMLAVSVFLAACGGGSDSSSEKPASEEVNLSDSTSELVPLRTYSAPQDTFGSVSMTMPMDGNITFIGAGVDVYIYDSGLNFVERNSTPFSRFQADLTAGEYLIEFSFWSSNARHVTAYSPQLMPFNELLPLENKVYSSDVNKAEYYRFTPTTDTTLNHSGSGVNIAIYDSNMTLIEPLLNQKASPYGINAGNYVVELNYFSSNTKAISISSPAI